MRFSLLLAAVLACAGCTTTTKFYQTETTLHVNQATNLWSEANYRYVQVGLMASAHAEAGSEASKSLGRQAMDALVKKAALGPNQALVDVTLETGTVTKDRVVSRVVTLRGDVIEFVAAK